MTYWQAADLDPKHFTLRTHTSNPETLTEHTLQTLKPPLVTKHSKPKPLQIDIGQDPLPNSGCVYFCFHSTTVGTWQK